MKDVSRAANAELQLANLIDSNCEACELSPFCESSHASQVVAGMGNVVDPKFILVGGSPARVEDRTGSPLAGPSGEFMDELLEAGGYDRSDVYITNTVKCWPPVTRRRDGYGGWKNQQVRPNKAQTRTCTELYLSKELEALPGVPIIPLGEVPLKHLAPGVKVSESHGQVIEIDGRKIIPMFHPSAGLQDPTKKNTMLSDWASLPAKLGQEAEPFETRGITDWDEIPDLGRSTCVAFDFETTDLRPAYAEIVGTAISTDGRSGFYYTGSDPLGFLSRVREDAKLVAHNAVYEYGITEAVLRRMDARPTESERKATLSLLSRRLEDTMIMARLLSKEFIGLKPLALSELGIKMTEFTDVVGKDGIEMADAEELARYAATDAVATWRLFSVLSPKLDDKERDVYALEKELIPAVAHIIGQGFRIDQAKLDEISAANEISVVELGQRLRKTIMSEFDHEIIMVGKKGNIPRSQWFHKGQLVGPPKSVSNPKSHEWVVNIGAPKDMQMYFNVDSADEAHLLELDHPLAYDVLEYKRGTKFKGSYVEPIQRSGDRLYGSFNSVGTDTGRFSASGYKLLDKTTVGINLQTAPASIKPVLIPDSPDYVLIDLDYSQIELRVLAHVAREDGMMKAYIEDRDLHREMMERAGISDRRIAKVMNFSLAYNPEDYTAAFVLIRAGRANPGDPIEISLEDAREYVALYREAWPMISDYYNDVRYALETREWVQTLLGRKYRATFVPGTEKIAQKKNWAILRKGVNHPIQGGAADIMKLAILDLWKTRPEYVTFKNTVHDSLVVQTHRDKVEETLLWAMPRMEQAYTLDVPIRVDATLKDEWESKQGVRPAGEYSYLNGELLYKD